MVRMVVQYVRYSECKRKTATEESETYQPCRQQYSAAVSERRHSPNADDSGPVQEGKFAAENHISSCFPRLPRLPRSSSPAQLVVVPWVKD